MCHTLFKILTYSVAVFCVWISVPLWFRRVLTNTSAAPPVPAITTRGTSDFRLAKQHSNDPESPCTNSLTSRHLSPETGNHHCYHGSYKRSGTTEFLDNDLNLNMVTFDRQLVWKLYMCFRNVFGNHALTRLQVQMFSNIYDTFLREMYWEFLWVTYPKFVPCSVHIGI